MTMQLSQLAFLALVAGASAGACPASVGRGAAGFAVMSSCGAGSCGSSMRVPVGEAFALCDPCRGEVGMQAIMTVDAAGTFTLIPTGLGATEMKAGECVAGLMLERDTVGVADRREAVALQANTQNNVTWTGVTDAPIPTPVGSFEPVRFCTVASTCTAAGDSAATCDSEKGQCVCSSQDFNGKTCTPVAQEEQPLDTVLVTSFKDAICSLFKNDAALIKQTLEIIAEVTGTPVLGYTIQCGTEPDTTTVGRGAQALQTGAGVVLATHAKILPSKVDAVTSGMGTEVADKVAQAPALKEVVGTAVAGRATLAASEDAKCSVPFAAVQVLKVVNDVTQCSALTCQVGYLKSTTEPTTCIKAEDVDPKEFVCLVDGDCTLDASAPVCRADGKCVAPQARALVLVDDDDLSTGAIVGLSVGLTVLFFMVVAGVVYMLMSKGSAAAATANHPENEAAPENEPVAEQV